MDTTDPPTRDDRSVPVVITQPGLLRERIDPRLRPALVSALAKSIRNFRKCPRFSSAWQEALRKLQQRDPKEYQNGLDFTRQLLRELPKALHRAAKDPLELDRLLSQVVPQSPSINGVEDDLRRLACCSGQTTDAADPAWDAVYDRILLGPVADRPQPITRSFDDLLRVRGLNLRPEIAVFLQRELPAQFAKVAKGEKTVWLVWQRPAPVPLNAGPMRHTPLIKST